MNKSIIKVGKATLVLSVTLIISCQSNEVANDPVISEIEQVEVEQEAVFIQVREKSGKLAVYQLTEIENNLKIQNLLKKGMF